MNSTCDTSPVKPLVSVGIPTYNRPEGLRRTLECITGQTYQNLEILVSDNCSKGPETKLIVQEFLAKDQRIRYYRQEVNKGPIFNFNFLLQKATGEYFMWAADDDEWNEQFIKKCLDEYKNNYSMVLCYSEPIKKSITDPPKQISFDSTTIGMRRIPGIAKFLLNFGNYECYGLMKRNIAAGYKWENVFGEDNIFIFFMALHGEIGRTSPGLFISGPGYDGTSAKRMVHSFGISRANIYFGYIFLFFYTIRVLNTYELGLNLLEKTRISAWVIRRWITVAYIKAVADGIKNLIKDLINSITH